MMQNLKVAQGPNLKSADHFKCALASLSEIHAQNARSNGARADRLLREALSAQMHVLKGELKFTAPTTWTAKFRDGSEISLDGVVLKQLRLLFPSEIAAKMARKLERKAA
jgi:hypothetical protein